MLCNSSEKLAVCYTTISNLAVPTPILANNVTVDCFLKGIFKMEQCIELTL